VGRDVAAEELPAKRQRRRRWWHKVSNLAMLALGIVLVLVSLDLSATPTITVLGDASGKIFLRSTPVYQRAARQLFASSVLNSNKVTVDAANIARQLHAQFPELEAVSVSLPIVGHHPMVYLQPATPRLVLTTQQGDAFVINHTGTALIDVAQAPHLDKLHVPTVQDQSGLRLQAGKQALDSNTVTFITEVVAQLQGKGVGAEQLILTPTGSELDAKVSGAGYMVKFNLRGNAREEAGTFLAVKQQLDAQHKQPGQYVDVRVSGRAYYK